MEMCIDKKSGRYASKLKITSRGFAVESKSKNLYDKLEELFYKELSRFVNQGVLDERAGRGICAATEEFIRNEIGKTPIVIVNLIDVMV